MSTDRQAWRIPAIDGFRAFACLMVYVYHVWQFAGSPALDVTILGAQLNLFRPIWDFPAGVDLFMVLSGFCLFWPLCKNPEALSRWNWREYATRRVRRIVPPYYMAIAYAILLPVVLVAAFRLLGLEANWPHLPSLRQLVTHVLFIHTLFPDTWDGITGAFWSLGLEAQFYIAFPFVIWAFRQAKVWTLIGMVAVSIFYRIVAHYLTAGSGGNEQMVASIFFLGRWMQFAAGMAAAWIVATHWHTGKNLRNAWTGTTLFVGAVGLYVAAATPALASLSPALPLRALLLAASFAIGIVAICATHTPARGLFANRVSTGLGFISYSVFLIHQPTAWYLSELFRKKLKVDGMTDFVLLLTVGFVIVLAISYVFFLLFEKPFLNTSRRARTSGPAKPILSAAAPQESTP